MDISTLQAFIAVAQQQSFSKASEQLHITQPAVSKRVAALESELGTQLFNRVARNIHLTETGKQLLPKALDLVDQAEDMQRFAAKLNSEIGGTLSVAISHHIGLHRMPPILKEFNARHPQVTLDIRFEDSDRAFNLVEQGEIEFAVITLPTKLSNRLQKKVIWQDLLNVVVSPEHPLAEASSVGLSEVINWPCVLPSSDTETYKIIQRHVTDLGLNMKVQMKTNNLESLKMLVGAGLGWSLLPQTMLDDSIVSLDIGVELRRELGLVLHRKRNLSNAAMALQEMIEAS